MIRPIATDRRMTAMVTALLLASCSAPTNEPERAAAVESSRDWVIPPRVETVRADAGSLVFTGLGQPGGRVVLRTDAGAAFAAVADASGGFEIRMARPAGDLVLHPETQRGQDAAPSPETILVLAGGPIAMLSPGIPTRRLDAGSSLGAIDTDGRVMVLSGRAVAGASVKVSVSGRDVPMDVTADAEGHWMAVLPDTGAAQIRINGTIFDYPGGRAGSGDFQVQQAGQGWTVHWSAPDGARQTTWLPTT
ncbi:hypothetical protein [Brevundimonas sp.]|uniref:hypothetical protein n=1 Tax=Brevundimonas sp. TaxID=1871086 RepID=UPI002AB972BD|nr:hypothetical protein [Brevundimonas sp.]MDZ4362238.1 hypothetical protein [Brevundimonas sp.]